MATEHEREESRKSLRVGLTGLALALGWLALVVIVSYSLVPKVGPGGH